MANPWFKFYASDYLNEIKLKGVSVEKRSCLLTALCYSAIYDGVIDTKYLTNDVLKMEAGVLIGGDSWKQAGDIYSWLVEEGFGNLDGTFFSFKNWNTRQETYLTNAERQAKYRERNEKVTGRVTKVTLEENRIDKNREEKKPLASLSFLLKIPDEDLEELRAKYDASNSQIKRKAEELKNYCDAKGKTYKNYRAFLENALDRDFGRRLQASPAPVREEVSLDPDAQRRVDSLKQEISKKMRVPNAN